MTDTIPRTGGGWRRTLLFVLLGLAVGVAGTLVVVAIADDDGSTDLVGSPRATGGGDTTTTVIGPGATTSLPLDQLDPDARDLVALADKGRQEEFHARYETKDARSSAGQSFAVSLEMWNRPPEVRRNVSITSDGEQVESADIRRESLLVRCGKPSAGATWQCITLAPGAANEPGGPAFGMAPAAMTGRPVTASDETVADQRARCFTVDTGTGSPEQLCLSSEGIPLRLTSGAAILELVSLERSVDDGAFEPPARPVGA